MGYLDSHGASNVHVCDKTRQEAPVSTQRDVAKVQRLAKASEFAAGITEGGCGNHGIYSTVVTGTDHESESVPKNQT